MQKPLLFTVIDVLEAVTNDIDLMTGISTEFSNIGQAYEFLEARIQQMKDKIAAIPDENEDYTCFSLMYTRDRIQGVDTDKIIVYSIDKLQIVMRN